MKIETQKIEMLRQLFEFATITNSKKNTVIHSKHVETTDWDAKLILEF